MKVYPGNDIRNVAVAGHGHSGKTSLVAGALFTTGATTRLTRVDEGNTLTDFDEEEIQRKITISTAVAVGEWKKNKINLLDTPGFNIFINDTKASLVAADAAMVVVDGVAGVEVQTEKVWGFAEEFKLPRILVINKLDRERSSFSARSRASRRCSAARRFRSNCPSERSAISRRHRPRCMKAYTYRPMATARAKRARFRPIWPTRRRRRTKRWSRWSPKATTRCWRNSSKGHAAAGAHARRAARGGRRRWLFPVLCASAFTTSGPI